MTQDNSDDRVPGLDHGLDEDGRIRREGDLDLVDPVFAPLVTQVSDALRSEFTDRLHSIYLYGSVPSGTAVIGHSDLDVSAVLTTPVDPGDLSLVDALAADLDAGTPVVDDVGILIDAREDLLGRAQLYNGAFHISCLCTHLWGRDLAAELPEQRPTVELARDVGRGAAPAIDRLAAELAAPSARPDLLRRRAGRRVARLAFTTVLARWRGWTSDPDVIRRVVTAYYPDREADLDRCVRLGWSHLLDPTRVEPPTDAEAIDLLTTSGRWWTAEYNRVFTP